MKYVTGMQVEVENLKTGKKHTKDVPIDECGKTVKIPYELANIDSTDIDINIRTRWYYESQKKKDTYYSPFSEKVNYKAQKTKKQNNTEVPVEPKKEENGFQYEADFIVTKGNFSRVIGPNDFWDYYKNHLEQLVVQEH